MPEAPVEAGDEKPEAPLKAPDEKPEAPLKAPDEKPEAPLKAPDEKSDARDGDRDRRPGRDCLGMARGLGEPGPLDEGGLGLSRHQAPARRRGGGGRGQG